jgi:TonB family protein
MFVICCNNTFAQTIDSLVKSPNVFTIEEDSIYSSVEEFPEYSEGGQEMVRFIAMNMGYPEGARDNGLCGVVIVKFIIERDGQATHFKILRGVEASLDTAVLEVLQKMPKWYPAMYGGAPVRFEYILNLTFNFEPLSKSSESQKSSPKRKNRNKETRNRTHR